MILPVNKSPLTRNLTHNAFADSLLSADLYTSDLLAEFSTNMDKLICKSQNAVFSKGDGKYSVREVDKYNETKCLFYHEIKSRHFHTKIELTYQKVHYAWSGFNLLFTNKIDLNYELTEESTIKIGHPAQKQCFVKYNNEFIKKFSAIEEGSIPITISIDLKDDIVNITLTDSKKNEEKFQFALTNHFLVCPLYFVIAIEPGENQYYNWLFMNNLQMVGYQDQYGYLLVDYFNKARKNYRSYTSDYMLEYFPIPNPFTNEYRDCIRIIAHMIQMKCYIIMQIDQYYVKNCEEYNKKHHPHEMLIYGIDSKRKVIYLEGFLKEGVFDSIEMTFHDFYSALKKYREYLIYLVRYLPHEISFPLNKESLIQKYKEYIEGRNSSECTVTWMPMENGVYGINIYKFFLDNTKLINSLAVDVRLAYTLWEHKKIMKERVRYLIQKRILSDGNMERRMEEIYLLSTELKNGAVYNRMKRRRRLGAKRITEILQDLYKKERSLYTDIVEELTQEMD